MLESPYSPTLLREDREEEDLRWHCVQTRRDPAPDHVVTFIHLFLHWVIALRLVDIDCLDTLQIP